MYHFSTPHLNKRCQPEPGETIWLIPIRYWELENKPEKFEVHRVTKNKDGCVSAYGYHFGYDHEVHVALSDFGWFFCEQNAANIQSLLANVPGIIIADDTARIVHRLMKEEN
jgi:hypothetical protein